MFGWAMLQLQVFVPSVFPVTPLNTPGPGAETLPGVVTCMSSWPGSALELSIQGQTRSQPLSWTAEPIQGSPVRAVAQTQPPFQGARGATRGWPA